LTIDAEEKSPVKGRNLVGELIGSELPDEYVVIGGHIDSWDVGTGFGTYFPFS
jgi:carboxypeptidase Q